MPEPGLELTIDRHLPDAEAAWRAVADAGRHYVPGRKHDGRMADAPVCMSIVKPARAWKRPGREAWSRKSRKLANGIAVM